MLLCTPYLTLCRMLYRTGFYAGYIASAFTFGRFVSSYALGHLTDSFGRKPVIIGGLLSIVTFSLAFGMSPSFGFAISSRCAKARELLIVESTLSQPPKKLVCVFSCPARPPPLPRRSLLFKPKPPYPYPSNLRPPLTGYTAYRMHLII